MARANGARPRASHRSLFRFEAIGAIPPVRVVITKHFNCLLQCQSLVNREIIEAVENHESHERLLSFKTAWYSIRLEGCQGACHTLRGKNAWRRTGRSGRRGWSRGVAHDGRRGNGRTIGTRIGRSQSLVFLCVERVSKTFQNFFQKGC